MSEDSYDFAAESQSPPGFLWNPGSFRLLDDSEHGNFFSRLRMLGVFEVVEVSGNCQVRLTTIRARWS
jgi:hypothetical protein